MTDTVTRTMSLLIFIVLVIVDDGLGLMHTPIDIKFKAGLIGYAFIGDAILTIIPSYKKDK